MKRILITAVALLLVVCGAARFAFAQSHQVVLTWIQSTVPTGATCPTGSTGTSTAINGNNVYRATTSGGEGTTPFAKLATPATTYTDTAVVGGTTYFYQVTGLNCGNNESAHSTEVTAAIPNPVPPGAPTGLAVSSVQ